MFIRTGRESALLKPASSSLMALIPRHGGSHDGRNAKEGGNILKVVIIIKEAILINIVVSAGKKAGQRPPPMLATIPPPTQPCMHLSCTHLAVCFVHLVVKRSVAAVLLEDVN